MIKITKWCILLWEKFKNQYKYDGDDDNDDDDDDNNNDKNVVVNDDQKYL